MPIFGLVWVASWVGCFFSSSQELLKAPEYPACVLSVQSINKTAQPLNTAVCSSHTLAVSAVKQQASLVSRLSISEQPARNSTPTKNISSLRPAKAVQPAPQAQKFTLLPVSYPGSRAIQTLEAGLGSGKLLKTLKGFLASFQTPLPTPKRPPVEIAPVIQNRSSVVRGDRPSPSGFGQCFLQSTTEKGSSPDQSKRFQVKYQGYVIGEVSSQQQATKIAQQLVKSLDTPQLLSEQIQPRIIDGLPVVAMGDRPLLNLDPQLVQSTDCNSELVIIQWVNNLRVALAKTPLALAEAQKKMYDLQETGSVIEGTASWYGSYFHGQETATGEIFDQHEFTAAHPSLPFGTYLKVTNLLNDKSVIVRVNDRGPYVGDRTLDLSREAARYLDSESDGVVPIQAVIMKPIAEPQAIARL